jgi:hypothetical protein
VFVRRDGFAAQRKHKEERDDEGDAHASQELFAFHEIRAVSLQSGDAASRMWNRIESMNQTGSNRGRKANGSAAVSKTSRRSSISSVLRLVEDDTAAVRIRQRDAGGTL